MKGEREARGDLDEETEVRVLRDGLSATTLLDVLALEVNTLEEKNQKDGQRERKDRATIPWCYCL